MVIRIASKIFLISILFVQFSFSQSLVKPSEKPSKELNEKQSTFSQFIHHEKVAFKLGYFGELVLHPGMTIGVDYTLTKKNWVTIHWDTDLGGYWHRWNNTSIFIKSSIGARLPISSLFVDLNLGVGYMHSFAAGTLYERSTNGGVEKATNNGHAYFMPNASLLFGWDGTRKVKLPWTFHFGVEAYLQYPSNHIFLPHAAAKVGFTYKLK